MCNFCSGTVCVFLIKNCSSMNQIILIKLTLRSSDESQQWVDLNTIIKLMKDVGKMEREIAHLGEEDFKKLFPQDYYPKYAMHQNVANFQDRLLKETQSSPPQSLKRMGSQPQITYAKNKTAVKFSRFDRPDDIIDKNKEETVRVQTFVKDLNRKLKVGASKSTTQIRTPLTGFQPIPQGVLDRLKLIQDSQYQAQLEYLREKRGKSYKYMNFVVRSRQQSMNEDKMSMKMDRSIIAESTSSKSVKDLYFSKMRPPVTLTSKPEIMQSLTYGRRATDVVQKARSQIASMNPQDKKSDIKCILAMNRSIRKINGLQKQVIHDRFTATRKGKTSNSASVHRQAHRENKNLIEMTMNIRNQVKAIEILSHYQTTMMNRTIKEKVKMKG